MGYRAAAKADTDPPRPKKKAERDLELTQRRLSKALADVRHLREVRAELLTELWNEGHTQAELAARLDRASLDAGGPPVPVTTVQKLLHKRLNGT